MSLYFPRKSRNKKYYPVRRSSCGVVSCLVAFSLPAYWVNDARGQEAIRQSLAGAAAAEAQKASQGSIGYYNMRMGDLTLRCIGGLEVQYNDNIRLHGSQSEDDFIVSPNLNTQWHYPVTEFNSLDLSISAGYSVYLKNPDLSRFFVNPGSGLLFNVYIGDLLLNLHDRVTVTGNSYQNPTVNGNGNNSSLENSVGLSATWDLNKLIVGVGYDHGNYISLGSGLSLPDSSSENIFLNAGLKLQSELTVGVEAGGSSVTYERSVIATANPDIKQWSAGGFSRWQVSEYLSLELHAGFSQLLPENTASTNLNLGSGGGAYFGLSVAHRVNKFLSYSLAAERSQNLQSYGQPTTTYTVRWSPNWNLFQKYSVSTPLWWTQGENFYQQTSAYQQYGIGLNVSRQITEKLSGGFGYQFVYETADEQSLNYTVNIISLTLSYRF